MILYADEVTINYTDGTHSDSFSLVEPSNYAVKEGGFTFWNSQNATLKVIPWHRIHDISIHRVVVPQNTESVSSD